VSFSKPFESGATEAEVVALELSHFPWPVTTITEVMLLVVVLLGIAHTKPFLFLPYLIYQAVLLFYLASLCILLIIWMPIIIVTTIFLAQEKTDQLFFIFSLLLVCNVVLLVIAGIYLAVLIFLFMCFFRCCQLIEMKQKIERKIRGNSVSYHQLEVIVTHKT
jgi:hypothetical protein